MHFKNTVIYTKHIIFYNLYFLSLLSGKKMFILYEEIKIS
jgi:hypothetical protein